MQECLTFSPTNKHISPWKQKLSKRWPPKFKLSRNQDIFINVPIIRSYNISSRLFIVRPTSFYCKTHFSFYYKNHSFFLAEPTALHVALYFACGLYISFIFKFFCSYTAKKHENKELVWGPFIYLSFFLSFSVRCWNWCGDKH